MISKLHKEILDEFNLKSGKPSKNFNLGKYLGTSHSSYHIAVPITRLIARHWKELHKDISLDDFSNLIDDLFDGKSYDEKCFAPKLLELFPQHRKKIGPRKLSQWLSGLEGWAEVDSLCQNIYSSEELLSDWKLWEKTLTDLNTDKNIFKRRASLVLLNGPSVHSTDHKFSSLAFNNIDSLITKKEIIITKAISWLLRSLIKNHKEGVEEYLRINKDRLPNIAVRETLSKIKTGKKS